MWVVKRWGHSDALRCVGLPPPLNEELEEYKMRFTVGANGIRPQQNSLISWATYKSILILLFLSFLLISCEDEPYIPTDGDNDQVSDIDPDEIVNIPDENLKKCVLNTMYWKEDGDTVIYAEDAARVEEIACSEVGDLTGLEYFVKLTSLWVGNSNVNTLEPLKHINNIEFLHVKGGGVTDLTPLENHNNLQDVTFTDVPIEDIEVFSNKTQIFRIA
ncbi:MAG: hypothetical protein DRH37_09130, partial [Deltaproteobacteria bacterium]